MRIFVYALVDCEISTTFRKLRTEALSKKEAL